MEESGEKIIFPSSFMTLFFPTQGKENFRGRELKWEASEKVTFFSPKETLFFHFGTSDQARLPAKFKHII